MTPQEREKHARDLATKHGATLHWEGRPSPRPALPSGVEGSVTGTRITLYAPEWNQLAYFSALHEVGHVACEHTGPNGVAIRYWGSTVACEAEAWLWAIAAAAEPIQSETAEWLLGREALSSYTGIHPKAHGEPLVQALCTRLGA